MQAEAARALNRWEPRLELTRVQVVSVLSGRITFRLSGTFLGDSKLLDVTV